MTTGKPRTGRKKGVPNKLQLHAREMAQPYAEEALGTILQIMRSKTTPAAIKVICAREVLDRAYGKPTPIAPPPPQPEAPPTIIELVAPVIGEDTEDVTDIEPKR